MRSRQTIRSLIRRGTFLSRTWRRAGPSAPLNVVRLGLRMATTRNRGLRDQIRREVLSWPGVTECRHQFGGVEFRLGRRELGHIHGDHLADLPFPVRIREQLVRDGRARPHDILPRSGWVSYPLHGPEDIPGAIDLFRLAYERALAKVDPAETNNS